MKAGWLLMLLTLISGCARQPAIAPHRIVSNNPCVDAVLARIAAPRQIGAVSIWSHDPASGSAPLDWARAHPALGLTTEELIAARPALVLTGNFAAGGTFAALDRAGIKHRGFGVPASLAESAAQVLEIGAAIGRVPQAKTLAAQMIAASAPQRARRQSAIIWQGGGFVPGAGTIQDEMLARAGFTNASARYRLGQWQQLPLETLLRAPPDIIFSPSAEGGDDQRALALRARLLRHLGKRTRVIAFPERLLLCGGPSIIEAMARLRAAPRRGERL